MPRKFHDTDPSKYALIDVRNEYVPKLITRTFDYEKQIFRYFKEKNINPTNYRVLNFKNYCEYRLECSAKYKKDKSFVSSSIA